jgi:ribosomal protein S12 methylthiotransferase
MELIPLIRNNPKICRYIDIPIQHITDNMLGVMKRSHNRNDTETILNTLRREIPGAVIRTTLIAGHPGETEKDFLELRNFVFEFRFDRLGVFAYSHEEDTYSYVKYEDDIPEDIKEQRVADLMQVQQNIASELNQNYIGRILKVIIDRKENEFFIGRTEYDSPEVDQEVLIANENNLTVGNFYNILINKASEFDLYGEPV